MNSIEFLAIRKLQKDSKATDYEAAHFIDCLSAGDQTAKAIFEMGMIEVADESYKPLGTPPLPAWCSGCPD